jgi:hypothetical protein
MSLAFWCHARWLNDTAITVENTRVASSSIQARSDAFCTCFRVCLSQIELGSVRKCFAQGPVRGARPGICVQPASLMAQTLRKSCTTSFCKSKGVLYRSEQQTDRPRTNRPRAGLSGPHCIFNLFYIIK